jgi:cytochrome c551/c552
MQTLHRATPLLIALATIGCASNQLTAAAAHGDQPAPVAQEPTTPPNAALIYWQHWSMISDDATEQLKSAYAADQRTDPSWSPDDDLTKLVEDLGPVVQGLMRAASTPACDFGLERELGLDLFLVHLGHMRTGARLLAIDARRLAAAGEHDAAADRISTVFRSAAHVRNDGFMLSGLVACALTELAIRETRHLVESGKIGHEARASLRAAAAPMTGDDPYGFKAALRTERDWTTAAVRDDTLGSAPADGAPAPAAAPDDEKVRVAAGALLVDMAAGAYDAALAAWDDENAAEQLAAIEERAGAGEWGPVAAMSMPPLVKCRVSQSAMEERLQWLLTALDPEAAPPPKE